jgi:hypothetical protein
MLAPFFDDAILNSDDYKMLAFINSLEEKEPKYIHSLLEKGFYNHGTLRPYNLPEGSLILKESFFTG